jgi:hypothetical protein
MGFRHAAVLSATSFFLGEFFLGFHFVQSNRFNRRAYIGVLFISFNVDRRILYGGVRPSEEDYADAFKFYTTFFEAPLAIKVILPPLFPVSSLYQSTGATTCSNGDRSSCACWKAA